MPSPADLPDPGIELGSPALQAAAAAAKLLQSCPTLCDPIAGSPPGSPVLGVLQAKTLEWLAFSFSNAWKWKVKVKSPSRVRLLATPWTTAHQAPLSMGFSRQEYWSGVPLSSPALQVDSSPTELSGKVLGKYFLNKRVDEWSHIGAEIGIGRFCQMNNKGRATVGRGESK